MEEDYHENKATGGEAGEEAAAERGSERTTLASHYEGYSIFQDKCMVGLNANRVLYC